MEPEDVKKSESKNSFRMRCAGQKGCGYEGPSCAFDSKRKKGAFACPKCRKNHTFFII